jgi:hypothetical protein
VGFTPDQSRQLQALMDSTARQQDQMFEAALRASADGWVRIPRTQVVEAGYEPLRAGADAIGLRVHAAVRFSAPGMYSVRPHVFPAYARYDWRGAVTMNVVDARVDPAPQNTAADSLHDVIRYGGAAQYEGGVLYRFTFDMIPSYVIRNAAGTRYCLYLEQFRAAGNLPRWSAIVGDGAPVRYSIDFSNLGFTSLTEPAFPQRTFYESFRTGGAPDCGPNPNVNF